MQRNFQNWNYRLPLENNTFFFFFFTRKFEEIGVAEEDELMQRKFPN